MKNLNVRMIIFKFLLYEQEGYVMYSAVDVARYIIWYCKRQGYSISNLKLQKILYFVQAEFLVNTGKPCFSEEIEAWDFGPVVPEVYHEFKFSVVQIFLELYA